MIKPRHHTRNSQQARESGGIWTITSFHRIRHSGELVPNLVRIRFDAEMQQIQHANELETDPVAVAIPIRMLLAAAAAFRRLKGCVSGGSRDENDSLLAQAATIRLAFGNDAELEQQLRSISLFV